MKIYYRKDSPEFYFMTRRENGLWLFSPATPDIDTLKLCECFLSEEGENKAFEEAVDVPNDLMAKFNSIYDKKKNYSGISEILKKVLNVSQEEIDKIYEHDPELIKKTKDVIKFCTDRKVSDYEFEKALNKVKRLLSKWDNDLDRVKAYMKEHGDLDLYWDGTIVDIFDCKDTRVRTLLHDFHACWGDRLNKIIEDAIELYPEEDDFDKRYHYVKEELKNRRD